MSIEKNLPFPEYQKRPGINSSILRTVDRYSEEHAKAEMDGLRSVESEAMEFGTAFHSLLLEGRKDYVVRPNTYTDEKGAVKDWHHASKTCKKWLVDNADKIVLTGDAAARLEGMVSKVRASAELVGLLAGAESELSVFAEKDGMVTKARIDTLTNDGPVIDWKTTTNANPEFFTNAAINRGYHLQAAWALDGLRKNGVVRDSFWLVAIETEPPYAYCILRFMDEPMTFLRLGRIRANAAFRRIKNAHETGVWPGYGSVFAENFVKPWQIKELEQTA